MAAEAEKSHTAALPDPYVSARSRSDRLYWTGYRARAEGIKIGDEPTAAPQASRDALLSVPLSRELPWLTSAGQTMNGERGCVREPNLNVASDFSLGVRPLLAMWGTWVKWATLVSGLPNHYHCRPESLAGCSALP